MAGQRKLFEEVAAEAPKGTQPAGGMIDRGRGGARGAIRIWLMVIFALVMAMIVVGGLTRLTDSGLSITEWKPVTGALPPMDAAHWEEEFTLYQQSPQYRLMNNQMTLSEFKSIYWWEWGHRQLGRVIGLVWALGFFGFLVARKIPTGWPPRLLGLGVLGGLQGAIGWWMVSSGLTGDMVSVASYRLAIHLGLAFIILGFIAWYVFALGRPERELMQARRGREAKLFSMSTGLMHFAFLQILLGALVAGIDAGRSYTDWPLMAGGFFPPQPFDLVPVWRNFFEDPGLVQFMHRIVGYLLVLFAIGAFFRGRKAAAPSTRNAFMLASGMIVVQMVIGIVTVLNASPLHIAIVHQAGAILTFSLILTARYRAGYPKAQSVRG